MKSKHSLNRIDSAPLPADDFVDCIPMRLGAVAGLLVGLVSAFVANADVWFTLLEVGIAFLIFAALGTGLKSLLLQAAKKPPSRTQVRRADAADPGARPEFSASPRRPIVIEPEDLEEYELRP
jgi:hypothetical protein